MRTLVAGAEPPRGNWTALLTCAFPQFLNSVSGTASVLVPEVPATGPVWRLTLDAPLRLRLDDGAWCSMCDHLLAIAEDGWRCDRPSCRAGWDFQGRHGRWLDSPAQLKALRAQERRTDGGVTR